MEPVSQVTDPNEKTYPGVELAYALVVPSHDWTVKRLDAVDARLQSIQAFAATVTVAAPVLATALNDKPDYGEPTFIAAMGLFAFIAILGTAVRALGSVKTISPALLYQKWLHYQPWEFKKNLLFWAGKNFEANAQLVNRKGWAANLMVLAFLGEAACLVTWAAQG